MALTRLISQFLDVTGDGTGSTDGAVDGSGTPVILKFVPTRPCEIARLMVNIMDTGNVIASAYGAIAGGLTNGIIVTGGEINFTGQSAVQTNGGWGSRCYDVSYSGFGAGVLNAVQVRWSFFKSGEPLKMDIGDTFSVTIQDDCTELDAQTFMIQGRYLT